MASLLRAAFFLATASSLAAFPLRNAPRQSTCNGHAELCSRSFANVTFAGTHDSYAYGDLPSDNQHNSVTQQLNDGIRMLQGQVHKSGSSPSGLSLCHTNCFLEDGGSLESYLSNVKSWLDANPNEVISILLVNSDNASPATFKTAYDNASLTSLSYTPPSSSLSRSAWPTLGQLISAKTPVVNFLAQGADFNSVPFLIDEFSNVWENPYDQTSVPFSCSVDRGAPANDKLYLMNHFRDSSIFGIDVPDTADIDTTNAATGSSSSVTADAYNCAAGAGAGNNPTFVLVDFYDQPSSNGPVAAANILNGLA